MAAGAVALGVTLFMASLGLLTSSHAFFRTAGFALIHQGLLTALLGGLHVQREVDAAMVRHAYFLPVVAMAIIVIHIDLATVLSRCQSQ